jgi:hypothetical protein
VRRFTERYCDELILADKYDSVVIEGQQGLSKNKAPPPRALPAVPVLPALAPLAAFFLILLRHPGVLGLALSRSVSPHLRAE